MPARAAHVGDVVAFIDIGTYSARLLVVRFHPNGSYAVLGEQKESVRLGSDLFQHGRIADDAMERAAVVCSRLRDAATGFNAQSIDVVATAATREARNQREFIDFMRHRTGLTLRVVSGKEEARLIYLGVSRGLHMQGKSALFVDIGGGSTELIVGDETHFQLLESTRLGAIRLSQMFGLDHYDGPIPDELYEQMRTHAKNTAIRALQRIKQHNFQLCIGSSGTILNLAEMAGQRFGHPEDEPPRMSRDELHRVVRELRRLPLEQRRRFPGINPDRADIILGGAAVIETVMDELDLQDLATSRRGLRDGLMVDYLARSEHAHLVYDMTNRRRSIMLLGRNCGFDEAHARRVADLALQLFDQTRELGLHHEDEHTRELLEYAALLHDLGVFLSYSDHQAHTYYLIRHAELVGFDEAEIALMACLARYHRKGKPRKSDPEMAELTKPQQKTIKRLYVILRIAETLERSHSGVVRSVHLEPEAGDVIHLKIEADGDCSLELWGLPKHAKHFIRAFDHHLRVDEPPHPSLPELTEAAVPTEASSDIE